MKKLLTSAAVCGLVFAAAPAHADIDLELGGYMKGYAFYTDQDDETDVAGEARDFDIIRDTELHVGGETALDNGLTVGFHLETEVDADGETANAQESYAYFSGGWGRVNFGAEDGANYLLQVSTPSADSNLDGLRQYVDPINYAAFGSTNLTAATHGGTLDYENNATGYADKVTYLSPIFSGFQFGASYTPDVADASTSNALNTDDVDGALGSGWEAGVRYEGMFDSVGVIAGAGYTTVDLEDNTTNPGGNDDDRTMWNVGLDLDVGPFGVGAAYTEDNGADVPSTSDEDTWVVGVDYTTGAFKLGASYLSQDNAANVTDLDAERWSGGVVYTYGPGMTFRGSVSYVEYDGVTGLASGGDDIDATSVLLGTQINF